MNQIFLSDKQVADRYGVARPSVWRWTKHEPSFPRPVSLSAGCTRWRLEDLEAWERGKATAAA